MGIEPLPPHDKGNFVKTVVKYTNTVGYANADGNLIVTEQTLRSPAYRVYLLLADLDNSLQARLHDRIRVGEAEFLPYFGKNECAAWWETENVKEYTFSDEKPTVSYSIATIFQKNDWTVRDKKDDGFDSFEMFDFGLKPETYIYFERIPVDFDERLLQYRLGNFAFTNFLLKPNAILDNLLYLPMAQKYVQLF